MTKDEAVGALVEAAILLKKRKEEALAANRARDQMEVRVQDLWVMHKQAEDAYRAALATLMETL